MSNPRATLSSLADKKGARNPGLVSCRNILLNPAKFQNNRFVLLATLENFLSPNKLRMDPLSALSLACNIMQIVSFVHEAYETSKRISEDGSADSTSLGNATRLAALSRKLDGSINAMDKPLTKEQHDLLTTAQKCAEVSNKLQKDLQISGTCRMNRSLF
jgi:hypothetical protein